MKAEIHALWLLANAVFISSEREPEHKIIAMDCNCNNWYITQLYLVKETHKAIVIRNHASSFMLYRRALITEMHSVNYSAILTSHTSVSLYLCFDLLIYPTLVWKERHAHIMTNAHIYLHLYLYSIRYLFIFVVWFHYLTRCVIYACLRVFASEFACAHICACICVHVGVYFWDCTSVISLLGKTGSFLLLAANAGHRTDISQHAHRLREWGTVLFQTH